MPKKKSKKEEEESDEDALEESDLVDDEDDAEALVEEEDEGDDDLEPEEDSDDIEEEEEDEPVPVKKTKKAKAKKAPAKKAAPKKTAKPAPKEKAPAAKKKARKATDNRNGPVSSEERIPILFTLLAGSKDGGTINELYHKLSKNKTSAALFPTRRSVKRVLVAREGDEFIRSTPTIWEANVAKPKAKAKKAAKKKA